MAKSLVFANGRLHVGLDQNGLVHDLYYPYVGLENHLPVHGLPHKIGVFVDGRVSWLDDDGWAFSSRYHSGTMVGETVATNDSLGIRIELSDAVDTDIDTFLRGIQVFNLKGEERQLNLYCHQAFMISDSASSDSAQYRPDLPAIMHYKGRRVFLTHLALGTGKDFDDFSIGLYDLESQSGTYRDAEDGQLSKNIVENGQTDSVMGLSLTLAPFDSVIATYALVAGTSVDDAEKTYRYIASQGVQHRLLLTSEYWKDWVGQADIPSNLPGTFKTALQRSLLVISAHIDQRGAVMASLDSSLRNHPQKDTYNFCWGRDAAYTLWPMLRLGYVQEILNYFDFAKRNLNKKGYLEHKYRADGSLGSTWLPYQHPDGSIHAPFQADETASTLFLAGQYFRYTADTVFLDETYESLIKPMADFLANHTREDGLPLPSYDLWEHAYLTNTYTSAVTYASLSEAMMLADVYSHGDDARRWGEAAERIKDASYKLFNNDKKQFYRGIISVNNEDTSDETIDISSQYGALMYGLIKNDNPNLVSMIDLVKQNLSSGLLYARFAEDDYYVGHEKPNVWPIASLWMAQVMLDTGDVSGAEAIINEVIAIAGPSGMLPEQVHPVTHQPTSLSPLVWSHAELISAILDYAQAKRD